MAAPTLTRSSNSQPKEGRSDPFVTSADNFFQEISRVQRLNLIYSLLGYGHSPLAITGPLGAGKSTLLLQLQKQVGHGQPTALLSAYPELAIESLLDEAQRQFTAALAAGGLDKAMGAVLLVDDADTLAEMVLRILLTPVSGQEGGQVRIVLTGKLAFGERLLSIMDPSAPAATIFELLPFVEEDSARFVRTRLGAVGITTHPLLLPAALKRLHQESGGWPGAIVTRARLALTPASFIPGKVPKMATPPPKTKAPLPKKNLRPVITRIIMRLRSSLLKTLRHAINSYWLWPTVGVVTLGIFFGWPQVIPTFPPTVSAPLSTLAPPPIRTDTPPPPIIPVPEKSHSTIPLAKPPSVEILPELHPSPASPTVASPPVSTSPVSATLPVPPSTQTPPAPATPNLKETGNGQSNDWIRAQRPQDYTLQLMSGNSVADLQEFLRRWELKGKIAIAHTQRSGRDWYSLLYGVYSDYNQAQAAGKQLSPGIKKPWVRTLGSVQKDLQ